MNDVNWHQHDHFGGEDKKDKKDNFFEIRMDNGHVGITT